MMIAHTLRRLSALTLLLLACNTQAASGFAPISGFARSFILGTELSNATITVLETGLQIKTDAHGHFGPFLYPIGQPITLQLEKWNYKTTQSGTFIVPTNGLNSPHNNITFQVPSLETYYVLASVIGAPFDPNSCHVTTTILAKDKTMDDPIQGEANSTVILSPHVETTPFYFGIFESGPLKGKTNPFVKGLTVTSEDGGVGFYNLPPREEPYLITAIKEGIPFTTAQFICRKDVFINISPPGGPMALI